MKLNYTRVYDNAYCRQRLENQGFFYIFLDITALSQIFYHNVKILCSYSGFLPLAILILDTFPFCFHFLTESLLLDYLGWFSVPLTSEQ